LPASTDEEREQMEIDRAALMEVFLSEADEQLGAMEQIAIALESHPGDQERIQSIFRCAHTLKGNASTLGLTDFCDLAHALEDVLDALRARRIGVSGDLTNLLLQAIDSMHEMLVGLKAGRAEARPEHRLVLRELAAWAKAAPAEGAEGPELEGATADALRAEGLPDAVDPIAPAQEPVLRVAISRLDQLLDLTGRLTVLQGQLGAILLGVRQAATGELLEIHHRSERLLVDLQDWVMEARMVPIGPTFRSYGRVVRRAAGRQGKRVRLDIEGEDVRVDTGVIDSIRDALTHLVRNAVDHGIEAPEVRAVQGKPPEGVISLRAFSEGRRILIQVADDGGGFNLPKIRARALALGITNTHELTKDKLNRLVFQPGFSTAETVTELSGRGVGMDVVLRSVEGLHGTVDIDSEEGFGTTVDVRLPFTISVIEGFWVGVGGDEFVIPLNDVVECVELPKERRGQIEREGIIDVRGEPLPFFRVRRLFGAEGEMPDLEQIVVVQDERSRVGLAVDAINGQRQAVVKPLSRLFRHVHGLSGSTLRADGRVALVIDVPRLLRAALRDVRSPRTNPTI
jgi:two-component system, chemotaxis family, sensor kinase CheA